MPRFFFLRVPVERTGIHMSRDFTEVLFTPDGFHVGLRLRFFVGGGLDLLPSIFNGF